MNKIGYIILVIILISCKQRECHLPISKHKAQTVAVKKDTLKKATSGYVDKTPITKADTLSKISKPFKIDGVQCYWVFTIVIYENSTIGEATMDLKNYKTKNIILKAREDIYDVSQYKDYDFDENKKNFKDVNFDGYKDYSVYYREGSGSGGEVYLTYIFNNKTKSFKYSEAFSGGNLEIDPVNKIVTFSWNMGAGWHESVVDHVKNGRIDYTELNREEYLYEDSLKTTYEKIKDKRIIESKIDTIARE